MNFVSNLDNNAQSIDIELKVETFGIVTLREFKRLYINAKDFQVVLNNQNALKKSVDLNEKITRIKIQFFVDFRATPNIPDKKIKVSYTLSGAGANPSTFSNEFKPTDLYALNTDYLILVK